MSKKMIVALNPEMPSGFVFRRALAAAQAMSADATAQLIVLSLLVSASDYHLASDTYPFMARYSSQAIAAGVPVRFVQMTLGVPGSVICDFAKLEEADLVVMGGRECWGIGEIAADNIVSYVVRHAACSVMVVRERAIAPAAPPATQSNSTQIKNMVKI